jgi:hypothetical protein
MEKPFIVLVTSGKHEDTTHVKVELFKHKAAAYALCDFVNEEPPTKYWRKAEIIDEGKEIELSRPA